MLLSIIYNSNEAHALNKTYELIIGFLPFGVYRGITGMAVGAICGLCACFVRDFLNQRKKICSSCLVVFLLFLIFVIFQPVTPAS